MTDLEQFEAAGSEGESTLAKLLEQITRKLERGEPVEPEDYVEQYPGCSGPLQALLPTLRDLSALGRSISRNRHSPTTESTPRDDDP